MMDPEVVSVTPDPPMYWKITELAFLSLDTLVGLILNAAVLYGILRSRTLRSNRHYLIVITALGAEVLFEALAFSKLSMDMFLANGEFFGNTATCRLMTYVLLVSYGIGMASNAFMALDRYYQVVKKRPLSWRTLGVMAVVSWVFPIVGVYLAREGTGAQLLLRYDTWCFIDTLSTSMTERGVLYGLILYYLFTGAVTGWCYVGLYRVWKVQGKQETVGPSEKVVLEMPTGKTLEPPMWKTTAAVSPTTPKEDLPVTATKPASAKPPATHSHEALKTGIIFASAFASFFFEFLSLLFEMSTGILVPFQVDGAVTILSTLFHLTSPLIMLSLDASIQDALIMQWI